MLDDDDVMLPLRAAAVDAAQTDIAKRMSDMASSVDLSAMFPKIDTSVYEALGKNLVKQMQDAMPKFDVYSMIGPSAALAELAQKERASMAEMMKRVMGPSSAIATTSEEAQASAAKTVQAALGNGFTEWQTELSAKHAEMMEGIVAPLANWQETIGSSVAAALSAIGPGSAIAEQMDRTLVSADALRRIEDQPMRPTLSFPNLPAAGRGATAEAVAELQGTVSTVVMLLAEIKEELRQLRTQAP